MTHWPHCGGTDGRPGASVNKVLVGNTVGSELLPYRVFPGRADSIRTSDPLLPKVSLGPFPPPNRHGSVRRCVGVSPVGRRIRSPIGSLRVCGSASAIGRLRGVPVPPASGGAGHVSDVGSAGSATGPARRAGGDVVCSVGGTCSLSAGSVSGSRSSRWMTEG